MKREWREYVPSPEVDEVAGATLDLMEFLVVLGKEKKLKREFKKGLGAVAYHAACHLRAQKIGFPGMRVLNIIPDTEVRMVEECSAVDGTWGMKAAHYETGRRYAGKMARGIENAEPDLVRDRLLALGAAHRAREQRRPHAPRRGRGPGVWADRLKRRGV